MTISRPVGKERAPHTPLAGVRVLELAHLMPGPMLTRRLADLGAEVVKVETPQGDSFRRYLPVVDGRSALYEAANRGKKSIVLDLSDPADNRTFRDLADVTDVIVDGFRAGSLEKLGIKWSEMRQRRSELVICSISGFGQDGPLASLPAHGVNIELLAGCSTVTGVDGDYRLASESAWAVELGALNGALATATAALHAKATGEGVWLDVSCWDAAVEAQRWIVYPLLVGERLNGLTGRHAPWHSIYRTRDEGFVLLMASEWKYWERFCRRAGREDLLEYWEQRDYSDHAAGSDDEFLRAEIAKIVAAADSSEWNERFVEWEVDGCASLSHEQILAHPHLAARGLVGESPDTGLPCIADPVRDVESKLRPGGNARGAPELGAHTEEVLAHWLSRGNRASRERGDTAVSGSER